MARVLPDVAGLDRELDYLVPVSVADQVCIGAVVRVPLHGRKVAGWVTAYPVEPDPAIKLLPLDKVAGSGPQPELIELAGWAAWRWAGRRRSFLVTASPLRRAATLPAATLTLPRRAQLAAASPPSRSEGGTAIGTSIAAMKAAELVGRAWGAGTHLLRLPPADGATELVLACAERGPALVLAPTKQRAAAGAGALRRRGATVAELPEHWRQARSGADVVIGARGATWGPAADLASVVVLDAHDEGYVQQQAPTWDAAAVAAERAKRLGAPCFWVSACPTLELLAAADDVIVVNPSEERDGWAPVVVADRRGEDPRLGLYSELFARLARKQDRRVVCVLNRKGRAALLDCSSCGEPTTCEHCGSAIAMIGDELVCRRCGRARAVVCSFCASDALRVLRAGVSKVREQVEALIGRPAAEVPAGKGPLPTEPVLVGTEAILYRDAELWRAGPVGLVAFLDFDQELLAPRYRAGEQALALLARASRLLGGRRRGGFTLVQTRAPGHPVISAAERADPSLLSSADRELRQTLRLPPFSALALLSGPGAAEMAAALGNPTPGGAPRGTSEGAQAEGGTVELSRVGEESWLVRSPGAAQLADALAAAGRPADRVRVDVGPIRF